MTSSNANKNSQYKVVVPDEDYKPIEFNVIGREVHDAKVNEQNQLQTGIGGLPDPVGELKNLDGSHVYEPKNAALNPLSGFDPLSILSKISFPNDAAETMVRHSKKARLLAILQAPLDLLNDPEKADAFIRTSCLAPSQQQGRSSSKLPQLPRKALFDSNTAGKRKDSSIPPRDQLTPSSWAGASAADERRKSAFGTLGTQKNTASYVPSTRIFVAGEEDEEDDHSNENRLNQPAPSLGRKVPLSSKDNSSRLARKPSIAQPIVIPTASTAIMNETSSSSSLANMVSTGSESSSSFSSRKQSLTSPPETLATKQRRHSSFSTPTRTPPSPAGQSTQNIKQSDSNAIPNLKKITEAEMDSIQMYHLARSAAAIMIQAVFRGWHVRHKFMRVMHHRLSILTKPSLSTPPDLDGLPSVDDLSVQESLWEKYKRYSLLYDKYGVLPPEYVEFCTAIIQATFRGFIIRRAYKDYIAMDPEERNELSGRDIWKRLLGDTRRNESDRKDDAARVIQNAWRRFYNTRVFLFYKTVINFREKGDPKTLLRFINPKEASLMDPSLSIHVRFRLGGQSFPPTIYYKIFVHEGLIDMNAFSPREYTKMEEKQKVPRQLFLKDGGDGARNKKFTGLEKNTKNLASGKESWYKRYENNDWRPVTDVTFQSLKAFQDSLDCIAAAGTIIPEHPETKPFHYSKLKRREELLKRRKEKRIQWLKQVYLHGEQNLGDSSLQNDGTEERKVKGAEVTTNTLEDLEREEQLIEQRIHDLEAELDNASTEDDSLIKWTRALDFDAYYDEWLSMGVTGRTDDPSTYYIDDEDEEIDLQQIQRRTATQSKKWPTPAVKDDHDHASLLSGVSPFDQDTHSQTHSLDHDGARGTKGIGLRSRVAVKSGGTNFNPEEEDDVDDLLVRHVMDHRRTMTVDPRSFAYT